MKLWKLWKSVSDLAVSNDTVVINTINFPCCFSHSKIPTTLHVKYAITVRSFEEIQILDQIMMNTFNAFQTVQCFQKYWQFERHCYNFLFSFFINLQWSLIKTLPSRLGLYNTPTASLQRSYTSPNKCPRYDSKQSDGEVSVILELWGMRSTPFFIAPWSCRIHWLHLCREVTFPSNECPRYDNKQSDGEVPVMLGPWGMRSTPSLPLLPGPLWPGIISPDRALSMG